jgi:predicted phosphoadenosine phosphosulfate sulfurtransferase
MVNKTLKDILFDIDPCMKVATENDLRQSAIEWIKFIRQDNAMWVKRGTIRPNEVNNSRENWIKYFFNITEEELK